MLMQKQGRKLETSETGHDFLLKTYGEILNPKHIFILNPHNKDLKKSRKFDFFISVRRAGSQTLKLEFGEWIC